VQQDFVAPEDNVIDGKAVADEIRDEIQAKVAKMHELHAMVPGLAVRYYFPVLFVADRCPGPKAHSRVLIASPQVVIVGARKDSEAYVRMKHKAAESVITLASKSPKRGEGGEAENSHVGVVLVDRVLVGRRQATGDGQ
jgi:hypothetical protein